MSSSPTVLSTFSGIGGFDLGLEAAGLETVACIEIDETARASLAQAPPEWRLLRTGDITSVARWLRPAHLGLRVGELGVLAGGPPCQPFSKAGQWARTGRSGLRDERATCLSSFVELVAAFRPAAILMENVQGFVQGRESAFGTLQRGLDDINHRYHTSYRLDFRVVNAADYGVPQRRSRAIVVALRDGAPLRWPTPTHRAKPTRAWDAIGDLPVQDTPQMRGGFATLLPAVPEGANYLHFTDRGGSRYKLFGYRSRYWSFLLKLAKAEPSWTLAAHPGPSTGPFHWDNRPLSREEMLRLQTFPRHWPVTGSHREQVRQIGNATPPLLAETFGRAVGRQVFGLSYQGRRVFSIPRRSSVPPPRRRSPVPLEHRARHGAHPPHPGVGKGPGRAAEGVAG